MTEAQLIRYACANWDQTPEGFALSESLRGYVYMRSESGAERIYRPATTLYCKPHLRDAALAVLKAQ